MDKILTPEEMQEFERANWKDQLRRAEKRFLNQSCKSLELEIEVKRLQLDKLRQDVSKKSEQHREELASHKAFTESLKQKHGLKDGWGYDPSNGNIIDGTDKPSDN